MKLSGVILYTILAVVAAYLENEETLHNHLTLWPIMEDFRKGLIDKGERFLSANHPGMCSDKNSLPDFRPAREEVIRRLNNLDMESETACTLIKNHFRYVVEPFVKAINECDQITYAGYAAFLTEAFVNVADYLCHLDGEHMLELTNPCIDKVYTGEASCLTMPWDALYTSEQLCREYTDTVPCLEAELQKHCKLSATRTAVTGLLTSFFRSCNY